MWSWGVVGSVVLFALAVGIGIMPSGHPSVGEGFYLTGTALFLVKFWTWEEARRQPSPKKWLLEIMVTIIFLVAAVLAHLWNHAINRPAPVPVTSAGGSTQPIRSLPPPQPTSKQPPSGPGQAQGPDHGTASPAKHKSTPPPEIPSAASQLPSTSDTDHRVFTDKNPIDLLGPYHQGHTKLQADEQFAPFRGLWIRTKGKITDIGGGGTPSPYLMLDYGPYRSQGASQDIEQLVECRFSPQWIPKLERYNIGDPVTVVAKLSETQNGAQLYLYDCEIAK